jgi:histidyl-tRNA synthetase
VQRKNSTRLSKKSVSNPSISSITDTDTDYLTPATKLRKAGIFSRVDDSNTSIGKRYARNDELGTPFGVTLDFACKHFLSPRVSPLTLAKTKL